MDIARADIELFGDLAYAHVPLRQQSQDLLFERFFNGRDRPGRPVGIAAFETHVEGSDGIAVGRACFREMEVEMTPLPGLIIGRQERAITVSNTSSRPDVPRCWPVLPAWWTSTTERPRCRRRTSQAFIGSQSCLLSSLIPLKRHEILSRMTTRISGWASRIVPTACRIASCVRTRSRSNLV